MNKMIVEKIGRMLVDDGDTPISYANLLAEKCLAIVRDELNAFFEFDEEGCIEFLETGRKILD